MEILPVGFTLEIPHNCFPLSTDSMALAYFVGNCRKRVLDLGSGCGTLGLLLCASDPRCHVDGIELDQTAHEAALKNIRQNHLESRMTSRQGDLRQPALLLPGSYDACVSNPPYFAAGPASAYGAARREDCCSMQELMQAASRALKYGGDLYLVHRPERLGEIIAQGAAAGMEAKKLVLLRHREGGNVSLVLVKLRKGGSPGLILSDWLLFRADGSPTELYRSIYHLQEV